MDTCDILIVGGGPAGSTCAWALRHSGLKVLILDRAAFPRDKVCGGWITPQVIEELGIDLSHYGRGRTRTLQPIHSFRVSAIGQQDVAVEFGRNVSYGIRRCEFDDYLLQRSGTRVRESYPILTIERTGHGWLINEEIHARLLVGAGGHFCPVAKFLGNAAEAQPVVAQETEFEMTPEEAAGCTVRPETPELFFCRDLVGYGWVFRKKNFLNIGLGRLDRRELHEHVGDFVKRLKEAGKVKLSRLPKFAGHAYFLFGHSKRRIVDDHVLLIGDSAGLAYPQSGEGIRPAIESGILAAEVIQSAAGNYGRNKLDIYAMRLLERFAKPLGPLEELGQRLPHVLRNAVARQLLKTHRFGRVVVEDWFLHMNVPPLANHAVAAELVQPPAA